LGIRYVFLGTTNCSKSSIEMRAVAHLTIRKQKLEQ